MFRSWGAIGSPIFAEIEGGRGQNGTSLGDFTWNDPYKYTKQINAWAPLQGGTGGTRPTQYFHFLTLRLWALHGKNRFQKALVTLNIERVAQLLDECL